ncbi:trypco2 family protein [Streptomyces sp. SudanB5_2050]|uniref:trypco2 family protein n=1 Tax=Streptomyces sp. SudanB5_2050 TaxID=3035274 RepID=UPI0036DF11CD
MSEVVSTVRAELQQAMADGHDEQIRFRLGSVEMEFAVEIRKDAEARTKVMVLPWSAEAKGGYSNGTTHRVKITLDPEDSSGARPLITDRSPERPQ